jgi:hypothetical protein
MGTHHTKPLAFSLAGLIAFAVASPAAALVVGGGPPSSDCVAAWQVTTADVAANRGRTGVDCQDGDPSCDADGKTNGTCTFGVSVCTASVAVDGCTADGVTAFTFSRKTARFGVTGPAVPTTEPVCGPATLIPVALKKTARGFRPSRTVVLGATATTEHGHDRDTVRLRCVPNAGAGECPANPNGGPRELAMVVAASGTDLDNGVTGMSHNFPLPAGSTLRMCLTACDPTTNPTCVEDDEATARVQRPTFGPPLPLFAAGVPTCIVNRFGTPGLVGATADLATGAVEGDLHLMSDVYLTAPTQVCPQCSSDDVGGTGTCTTGRREGQACRTEAIMEVSAAPAGSRQLAVSSDCLPSGPPVGTLSLTLPLTTSTAELAGPHACGAKQDDGCNGGTCDAVCTGSACVATTPEGECLDANGGLAQLCCSNNTKLSCFPTRDGGSIVRTGMAGVAAPAWPEPTYPKSASATLVSTFCEPATGSTVVDIVTGLPGPGALLLPVEQTWVP